MQLLAKLAVSAICMRIYPDSLHTIIIVTFPLRRNHKVSVCIIAHAARGPIAHPPIVTSLVLEEILPARCRLLQALVCDLVEPEKIPGGISCEEPCLKKHESRRWRWRRAKDLTRTDSFHLQASPTKIFGFHLVIRATGRSHRRENPGKNGMGAAVQIGC